MMSLKLVARSFLMAIMMALLFACSGDDGSVGPQGEKGEIGNPGEDGEDGDPGKNGEDGDPGKDGKDGENGLGKVPDEPMTSDEWEAFLEDNAGCLACHEDMTPHLIEDYSMSKMAKNGVGCEDCHLESPDIAAPGEGHRLMPAAETCGACHPNQYKGHRANRHSVGFIRMLECGRYDDFPKEFQVGSGYHFTEDDVEQLQQLMNTGYMGTPGDASPLSMTTCGSCHTVENRCGSCHGRHRFEPEQAREPGTCGTCHMGPDHPQLEMYETSKHGVRFATFGDTGTTPTCVDCHQPYNKQMLGRKIAEDGTEYTDHDLSMGIAYGPVGGGTTRKGFIASAENGRVKFKARDADALYEELWYDRQDEHIYDEEVDGAVVFNDLYEMSIADAGSTGKQDYSLVQPADSAEKLLENREFMRDQVCGQCHSNNFADENLLVADLIHEDTKIIMGEAWDIVKAMALTGHQNLPSEDKPENAETGSADAYAANMKTRNLSVLERLYFETMKFDAVMTWKGAYHQNPDYAHWLGYNAMVMKLGAMGDEATDSVLTRIWIEGDVYPGATGNVYEDGLYQGVVYATGSLENVYDKFPGPNDPGASLPIDVDMDGEPEFLPVDGQPGTFTINGKEVSFH